MPFTEEQARQTVMVAQHMAAGSSLHDQRSVLDERRSNAIAEGTTQSSRQSEGEQALEHAQRADEATRRRFETSPYASPPRLRPGCVDSSPESAASSSSKLSARLTVEHASDGQRSPDVADADYNFPGFPDADKHVVPDISQIEMGARGCPRLSKVELQRALDRDTKRIEGRMVRAPRS